MRPTEKLQIGNVVLDNNLILAPMAGVSDLPFRLLCKEQGAGLVCMEMVSAKAIYYGNKNTEKLMEIRPEEQPVSLQLFGSDPNILADMAAKIEERPFAVLDFNMGCPVPKVVKNGEGSALMNDPRLVEKILSKLVQAVKKPVTVKIRKGFDEEHINAVEIARIAESCGVAAVTVHGRTRQQYYAGAADWDIIRCVKEAVSIPVIGNGDLRSARDVIRMREETGCDGFMIGREAEGNPWIFRQILHELEAGEPLPKPSVREMADMILRHAGLLLEVKGEYIGIREIRKHAAWYTAGYKNSSRLRGRINEIQTYGDLERLLEEFLCA
ncbi:MAG: tRNA dihydrouridine synthase DusB [Clostridiales bacterium]|nr:tRNA dihydrouridine synthase DusB [Clostridiales bacterium]